MHKDEQGSQIKNCFIAIIVIMVIFGVIAVAFWIGMKNSGVFVKNQVLVLNNIDAPVVLVVHEPVTVPERQTVWTDQGSSTQVYSPWVQHIFILQPGSNHLFQEGFVFTREMGLNAVYFEFRVQGANRDKVWRSTDPNQYRYNGGIVEIQLSDINQERVEWAVQKHGR